MADEPKYQVDLSILVEKLNDLQSKADGEVSRGTFLIFHGSWNWPNNQSWKSGCER